MRHLLSPPTCLSVAARREQYLKDAEEWASLAEEYEMKAIALKHVVISARANRGKLADMRANDCRRRAQVCIAAATELTDYTHPLDRERESWILLPTLLEDAERRAPHPVVLRPRKR